MEITNEFRNWANTVLGKRDEILESDMIGDGFIGREGGI